LVQEIKQETDEDHAQRENQEQVEAENVLLPFQGRRMLDAVLQNSFRNGY
jgi:hypothetical protein